jgi:hypothetical protein
VTNCRPGRITEEMIEDVEEWISRDGFELEKTVYQVSSSEPRTYFYTLGLVFGTIDRGLRYAWQAFSERRAAA